VRCWLIGAETADHMDEILSGALLRESVPASDGLCESLVLVRRVDVNEAPTGDLLAIVPIGLRNIGGEKLCAVSSAAWVCMSERF
jgi:hypothetical protein